MRRTSLFASRPTHRGGSQEGGTKLSVIMAARNEERTVEAAVTQVLEVRGPFELELIVVDDGSTDATLELVRAIDDPRLIVLAHPRARGKGAAVLSGVTVATGTHVLLFDADLEYAASDIPTLMQPVVDGLADVVYGARVAGMGTAFVSSRFKLGSDLTTLFANLVFDAWLADMHTCLKLVPAELFRELQLTQQGFGLDTELTGELLRRGIRPYEVACSYRGRSRAQGKKISVRDGLECLRLIVAVRLRGLVDVAEDEPVEPFVRPVPADRPAEPSPALSAVGEAWPSAAAPINWPGSRNDVALERHGRIIALSGGEEGHNGL